MTEYLVRPEDKFHRKAILKYVVDGDTLKLDIDLGWHTHLIDSVRLARCDTPESNRYPERPAGQWVTKQVKKVIEDIAGPGNEVEVSIHSLEFNSDKYARCVTEAWIVDMNLSQWLLDKKYAWATNDKGSIIGPRDIDLLTGIPDEIRQQVREYRKAS